MKPWICPLSIPRTAACSDFATNYTIANIQNRLYLLTNWPNLSASTNQLLLMYYTPSDKIGFHDNCYSKDVISNFITKFFQNK